MTGLVIHFNGFAGVGKLTTAKALSARLNGRLIDNHRIIDAARIPWEHGTDEYLDLLARLTREVYIDLARLPQDEIHILTNYLAAEQIEDVERVHNVARLAAARGVPFVPILLDCKQEENFKRIQGEDRASKSKLRCPDVLAEHMTRYTMYHPEDEPHALRLDVTNSAPEQTVDAIVDHLRNRKLYP